VEKRGSKKMNFSNETLCEQELNSRLERIFIPHVSTVPGDEASIEASKPAKKKHMLGVKSGKGILIFAMVSLVTLIAVAAEWPHSLTENLKSYKRGVLESIFAVTSKGQRAAQAAPAPADVTAPDVSEILNRLNAIDRSVSSMQQNVNELAAGQAQIRKTQLDIAVLQSRFLAAQTIANAKQNKQSTPDAIEGRRFSRRDYH
jgi:hypothetical protein